MGPIIKNIMEAVLEPLRVVWPQILKLAPNTFHILQGSVQGVADGGGGAPHVVNNHSGQPFGAPQLILQVRDSGR